MILSALPKGTHRLLSARLATGRTRLPIFSARQYSMASLRGLHESTSSATRGSDLAEKRRGISPRVRAEDEPPMKKIRLEDLEQDLEEVEMVDEGFPEVDEDSPMAQTHQGSIKQKKHNKKGKKKREPRLPDPCTGGDVLYQEIRALIGGDVVDEITARGDAFNSPFVENDELVVTIEKMGGGGSGIALAPKDKGPWAIVVPKALPGEKVRVRISRWERMHSLAELLEVLEPNTEWRDDSRIGCKYFSKCGGCQYQMLSYNKQLELKRDVIVRAYKNYSKLPASSVPVIGSTIGSPLTYGYRTKLTPHFERAPRYARDGPPPESQPEWLKIGFEEAYSQRNLDIEECPIATSVINKKYSKDREHIVKNILSYKKGVSLMYRDSLDTSFDAEEIMKAPIDKLSEAFTKHVCVTDQKRGISRELVGDHLFEFNAGGFFQNNNSILPLLVGHVKDLINPDEGVEHPTHLVDTYCGSGLFAITLSSLFTKVAGIELSKQAIESAERNARLNNIPVDKISFRSGDATNIFEVVKEFPGDRTVVVIDPPRKGCDDPFIRQLLKFRSKTVVYVSCNVNTQARDIGQIIQATEGDGVGRRYRLESLCGFDLFPQTAHVESVALLRLY